MPIKDILGLKFNRLTVIKFVGTNKAQDALWECKCDCGNSIVVKGAYLRNSNTKSCGCLKLEKAAIQGKKTKTHGLRKSRFYSIWLNMRDRCFRKSNNRYEYYGAKGITVCEEWLDFNNFKNDMYESYLEHVENFGKKNTTIDRENVHNGYCKENCRWATIKEQANNKGVYKNQSVFKAIREDGFEVVCNNQNYFAHKYNLSQGCISNCLNGIQKTTGGWRIMYLNKDDTELPLEGNI